jgi:hypothetical protein
VSRSTQLIRGGDAANPAADDDDIHDSFSPEGARPDWFTSRRPRATGLLVVWPRWKPGTSPGIS